MITEGPYAGEYTHDQLSLKSLDEEPRWEYPERNNEDSIIVSDDSCVGPYTQKEITILKSLDDEYPSTEKGETSNLHENVSPQKTDPQSGPEKRVSWGIPLHAEALDIPQSTMICPEGETDTGGTGRPIAS